MAEAPPVNTPPWLDKSLWLVVLTPLFMLLNSKLGLSLDATEVAGLVLPVVVYILSNKWKTAHLQSALIRAKAANDNVVTEAQAAAVLKAG